MKKNIKKKDPIMIKIRLWILPCGKNMCVKYEYAIRKKIPNNPE